MLGEKAFIICNVSLNSEIKRILNDMNNIWGVSLNDKTFNNKNCFKI